MKARHYLALAALAICNILAILVISQAFELPMEKVTYFIAILDITIATLGILSFIENPWK